MSRCNLHEDINRDYLLWFGALKLFPGLSPAEALAGGTISTMTMGLIPPSFSIPALGLFELLLGIGFLLDRVSPILLVALLGHMVGAALPLLLMPETVFGAGFLSLTMEGQYIIKHLVIISGAFVVGAGTGSRENHSLAIAPADSGASAAATGVKPF